MADLVPPTDTRDIVIDEVLPHAPEVVWKALTDSALIGRWLMAPQGFAPVVGTRFTYQTTPSGPWDGIIHCEVLEVEPNRRLVYAWKGGHPDIPAGYGAPLDSRVSFTLTPTEAGVRVQLVHAGFVMPRNAGAFDIMGEGWKKIMPRLVDDILAAVQKIRDLGVTVLLVEQRLAEALEIADRAYVLQTGRIVMSGPAKEIAADDAVRRAYLGI